MDFRSPRRASILRVWGNAVVSAAVGSLLVSLLFWWRSGDVRNFARAPLPIIIAATLAIGLVFAWRHPRRPLAALGMRHPFSQPPLLLSGAIGAATVLHAASAIEPFRLALGLDGDAASLLRHVAWRSLWIALAVVGTVALVSAGRERLLDGCRRRKARRTKPIPADRSAGSSFDALAAWLADDEPIRTEAIDAFRHRRIAERIVERLVAERSHSQAIVGRLGAGKTSLRNLVAEQLRNLAGGSIRVVPIELWRFETSRAAVEEVLRALIDAIGDEVNVVGLRGLPTIYAEAMSAAGGWSSVLARMQSVPVAPLTLLRRIDDVATAIGIRYVLWVEDLERFAGGRAHAEGEAETPEELVRLAPIRALLHSFGTLSSIAVITATTSLRLRLDVDKIARFVEEIPPLDEEDVASLLARFRTACLSRLEESKAVDAAAPGARKKVDAIADPTRVAIRRELFGRGRSLHDIADALPRLCRTPRTLKQGMRRTFDAWGRLVGEIDFDDLLTMNLVRAASPDAFALVREYLEHLRGRTDSPLESENARRRASQVAWDSTFGELPVEPALRDALRVVIEWIFHDVRDGMRPQGLRVSRPTDYWQRFMTEELPAANERDQVVLGAIRERNEKALLNLLERRGLSDSLEQFAHLLPVECVRALLVPLVKRRAPEGRDTWAAGESFDFFGEATPPGLIPLWRLWNRRTERGEIKPADAYDPIIAAFDIAIDADNLALTLELEEHFGTPSDEVVQLLRDCATDLVPNAKEHLRRRLVDRFKGQPERLARALKGTQPWTLLNLCWGIDRIRKKDFGGLPFEGWRELATTIIDATQEHPKVMLRQFTCLAIQETGQRRLEERGAVTLYRFDVELARRLFGDENLVVSVAREAEKKAPSNESFVRAVVDWQPPAVAEEVAPHKSTSRTSDNPSKGDS